MHEATISFKERAKEALADPTLKLAIDRTTGRIHDLDPAPEEPVDERAPDEPGRAGDEGPPHRAPGRGAARGRRVRPMTRFRCTLGTLKGKKSRSTTSKYGSSSSRTSSKAAR